MTPVAGVRRPETMGVRSGPSVSDLEPRFLPEIKATPVLCFQADARTERPSVSTQDSKKRSSLKTHLVSTNSPFPPRKFLAMFTKHRSPVAFLIDEKRAARNCEIHRSAFALCMKTIPFSTTLHCEVSAGNLLGLPFYPGARRFFHSALWETQPTKPNQTIKPFRR